MGFSNLVEARKAGIKLSKEDCVVIDLVDSTKEHSLVSLPSIFGMPPNLDLKGGSILPAYEVVTGERVGEPRHRLLVSDGHRRHRSLRRASEPLLFVKSPELALWLEIQRSCFLLAVAKSFQ